MRRKLLTRVESITLACGMAMVSAAYSQPTGYEGYQVVQIAITSEAELERLRKLQGLGRDFQLWSEALGIGPMEVRVAPAAKATLDASRLAYEVLVKDLQRHIDELYSSGRGGGFFDYLRTYDQHVQFMTNLVRAYPELAEMIMLGSSVAGRPLWALRITGPGENKPGVMYHGPQHGNEQAGASVVAYAAQHLLTNYDTDPEVAALVDNVEWFLLPIMNPDGYVSYDRYNAHGVDLNRNWGGPGSGQDPTGGPDPFSEPETAAMRDFFLAHPNVRVHIDFHGYINMLMWPWGHSCDLTIDHWTFDILGLELRNLVWRAGGGWYEIGTICQTIYSVSGGSADYTYGELGLWAFGLELAHSGVPEVCEEFLPTMLFLSGWIFDCNGNAIPDVDDIAVGTSQDCNANGVPDECESEDCNDNGVPDILDIAAGTSQDCNANGVPDECDPDCNGNGVADECDIADGTGQDEDGNGVPDECQLLLFVDRDAPPGGDGRTWATAYDNLQEALGEPYPNTFSQIWVAAGTYAPAPPDGDRTATFQLISGVPVYGGFVGWETSLEQRDWVPNETILSGDLNGNDGPGFENNDENSYHVVTGSGTDPTSVLNGFTITAGNANGSATLGFDSGGGMYNDGGSPTVTNCTFSGGSADLYGGGLYNTNESSPTVTNCTFSGNSAARGGGGISNTSESSPTVSNCTFSGNGANNGGGVFIAQSNAITLTNCTFSNNSADNSGGGMYIWDESRPTLTNCILWANSDSGGTDESAQIDIENAPLPVVNYSCIQGLTGVFGGIGNIGDDPLFIDPDGPDDIPGTEDDNLRLSPGSPCINTGDPDFEAQGGKTDLDGYARVLCSRVDMGAYEFGIGDFDCDQVVDLTDFANWIACMTGPAGGQYADGCEVFDFDADDDVDLIDFAGFQVVLTDGNP